MIRQRLLYRSMLVCVILYLMVGCGKATAPSTEDTRPALTNGTDRWQVTSVIFQDTADNSGEPIIPSDKTQTFLRVDFDCSTGKSLLELKFSFKMQSFYVPGGIPDVYVMDSSGTKFLAVMIENCSITVPVSKDSKGFTLHFMDLQPIELGK